MAAHASAVEGGFADPVFDAQAAFRAALDAFAAPGTVADLGRRAAAPAPLGPAAAALLLALADGDAPVWLPDPEGADAEAAAWLRFQAGAPVTADPARAAFAALPEGDDPVGWARFPRGTPDYPDRSATLILPVRDLDGGPALALTGPGIEAERRIAPLGLPDGFVAAMAANRDLFPLGFDLVLVSGSRLLALPRSTRIREG